MRKHALLSASGAARWMNCPPSARLEETLPAGPASGFAKEGTQAHAMAEKKLRAFLLGGMPILENADPEMNRFTDEYVSYVIGLYRERQSCLLIEERVDFSRWVPEGFGTADTIILSDGVMDIIDLKYGKGIPVYADESPQLLLYAAGALNQYGLLYDIQTVRCHIVQPRLNNFSSITLKVEELETYMDEEIKPKAEAAWLGKGEFHAGSWCRFCRAKGSCKARAAQLTDIPEGNPALLDDDGLADVLEKIRQLSKLTEDLEREALDRALAGSKIRGFKLVEARTRRSITDESGLQERLKNLGYPESSYMEPRKMMTLSRLEKTFGKKIFNEIASEWIDKPKGEPVLAPLSDRRKEITEFEEEFNGNA